MPTFTADNFTPRLVVLEEANGTSLTRANIQALTRESFAALGFQEIESARILANAAEAKMLGVKEASLMDLLRSRQVRLPESRGGGQSASVIAPYSLVPRRNIVNANHFQIEAGAASEKAGVGGRHSGEWKVTVNVGSSWLYSSPQNHLTNLEKYFLPGKNALVEWITSSTDIKANFKIIEAVNADSGGTSKATVYLEPNYTDAGWAAAGGTIQGYYSPTAGQLTILSNSVSDYESEGGQYPGYNDWAFNEYWQQTIRWAWSVNDQYKAALNAPNTNDFFRKFRTLDITRQRALQEERLQREFIDTVFYGQRINEKQTVETYPQLPQVKDPTNASMVVEFKANTIGIRGQLVAASRVTDKGGAALEMDSLFSTAYNLKRNRGLSSGDTIDVFTDRITRSMFREKMQAYYKTKFATDLTAQCMLVGQNKLDFNQAVMFDYDHYYLPDQGVWLAVYSFDYFDDKYSSFASSHKGAGRQLWFIDWSDIQINVPKMASVKRTTNVADEIYRFVITPVLTETMLNSKTIEVRVGNPNLHAIISNWSTTVNAPTAAAAYSMHA